MAQSSSLKKITLLIAIAIFFTAAVVITAISEKWVENNPTPVKQASAQELDAGAQPAVEIGSTEGMPVRFSLECGFYSSGQKLYLTADGAEKILYTTDGSNPQTSGKTYRSGITLKTDESMECRPYSVTACAQYEDGSFSEPVTRSYFLDSEIADRFDCLVFSVTADPDDLYNYEDGIFISGKMRDDYLATNPTKEIQPTDPANWNQRGMESERKVYLEVYEYDGTCVISQTCGMRIFGGWSRSNPQKNLRFFAREEYDPVNNRFRYEFFPDALDANGDKIKSQKRISLRACANDNGALFLRDDVMSYLAMAAGIDAKHSRPAAVFLNGEYYGFSWCQEVFSDDWLDHKYSVEDGEWDIIKGCEYMIKDDPDDERLETARNDWEKMYSYAYKDLTDDAVFAELEKMIDVDNFLKYYALNSYIGNGDWPNNNYKVYRFVSGDTRFSMESEKFDGRWRFLLYDTDFSLGLYGHDYTEPNISNLFKEDWFGLMPQDWDLDVHDDGEKYQRSDLLIAMCKRPEIRQRFANIVMDMMNWYFSPERVSDKLDEMHVLRLHELVAAANAGTASVWSVSSELDTAKNWIKKRPASAKRQLEKVFSEFSSTYEVSCEPTENAVITVNTAVISEDENYAFVGQYFKGTSVTVSCVAAKGYDFDCWVINGDKIYDQTAEISDALYGDSINIELKLVSSDAAVDISEVCYKGGSDYIILTNTSDKTLLTKGLTISDDASKKAFIIPTAEIKPGASMKIICKNYSRGDALGSVECDFSLKEGETLILKNSDGEVIRQIYLRDAPKNSALRLDRFKDSYFAFTPFPKQRILEAELPSWGGWGGWGGWGW